MMRFPVMLVQAVIVCVVLVNVEPVRADAPTDRTEVLVPNDGRWLEEPPIYGVGYDRWEPTFYTGFAPRTLDPKNIHLHVGRGNQLRATVVLSDAALESYARDLLFRAQTYLALVDAGQIVLTQNRGLEEFERTLKNHHLDRLVAEEDQLSDADVRERNLQLLERLNPGRVFRIKMPADEILRRWVAEIRPRDRAAMTQDRQLELLNLMLPTRLWIAELDPAVSKELVALVKLTPQSDALGAPGALDAVRPAFFRLFEHVSQGLYPVVEEKSARGSRSTVQFVEFTAIYPIGSFNEYAKYRGRKIPMYPTPGRRALTTHQRTKTVDHIPDKAAYSYSPWLPYMHVGTTLHNSFHTLWWRMATKEASFLPASWKSINRGSRDNEPYRYLWLLSRGPMSHGCTHVNAGHISELRQLLPSETKRLYEIDSFHNKSHLYDVFDIDGNFVPEVMGVRYFIAYSLRNKQPHRLRVRNERHAYYDWLYGGDLQFDARDGGFFRNIKDGHFIERDAVNGREYERIGLYESQYEPERIQFYQLVDIPFARELRKVNVYHPFPGVKLTAAPVAE